ncbi:hypothetical protein [Peribacillus frigoritolerans]|uniref:hypothetical protein n=1 Tax=Peribacillus castrilensis TaxID=2897690 RepID=UPI00296ECFC0|nr:hypothetical protein [Peribacillus castrilensis]
MKRIKILSVLEVIQNGIFEENDEIKLNLDYAKENGLSTAEVNNLQQALIGISSDDLKEIEKRNRIIREGNT